MLLAHFPLKNQNADTSETNRAFDCVPTALAACLEYTLARPFDGAAIKDAVYGASYQGGTAAAQYIDFCKAQGASLVPIDGSPTALLRTIRAHLAECHPLLITEPDPYAKPSLGWSHVVAMCGFDEQAAGTLTAMDPFIGKLITLPDAEWQARLEFNQVWAIFATGEDTMRITINSPNVGIFFTEQDSSHWLCKQTGQSIQDAMLENYQVTNGLLYRGLPTTGEIPIEKFGPAWAHLGGIVIQFYERCVCVYDPGFKIDHPPGATNVYPLHLYNGGPGTDPLVNQLQKQLTQLGEAATKLAQIKAIVD